MNWVMIQMVIFILFAIMLGFIVRRNGWKVSSLFNQNLAQHIVIVNAVLGFAVCSFLIGLAYVSTTEETELWIVTCLVYGPLVVMMKMYADVVRMRGEFRRKKKKKKQNEAMVKRWIETLDNSVVSRSEVQIYENKKDYITHILLWLNQNNEGVDILKNQPDWKGDVRIHCYREK